MPSATFLWRPNLLLLFNGFTPGLFFVFKHTLTGHSGKVMAAKYVQEPIKVVTGSHDRTLKIWDLRSIACIETKFAGSSCNDLCTTDSLGSTIISGHYDKKIRFWDIRTEKQADDVLMPAKITSLDLSKGEWIENEIKNQDQDLFHIQFHDQQIAITWYVRWGMIQ